MDITGEKQLFKKDCSISWIAKDSSSKAEGTWSLTENDTKFSVSFANPVKLDTLTTSTLVYTSYINGTSRPVTLSFKKQ